MAIDKLPETLLMNPSDVRDIIEKAGGLENLEPLPAVMLHNTDGLTLMAGPACKPGELIIRKSRRWYRVRPSVSERSEADEKVTLILQQVMQELRPRIESLVVAGRTMGEIREMLLHS